MSGSFGGAPISPFPSANALLDIERLNQSQSPVAQQNRLLDLQQKQQQVGANQIEYVSRAASVVDQASEAEQPALYQQLGQQLVDAGVIPKLPPYPGPARIKQLAGMGTSSEKLLEQAGLGRDYTSWRDRGAAPPGATPGAAVPGAAAAGGGAGGFTGGAPQFTGDREKDRAIVVARESGGDPAALNYVARQDPTAYARGATASGKYQFVNSTWREGLQLAGLDPNQYPTARDAPEGVQDKVFDAVYGKYGTAPWDPSKWGKNWATNASGGYDLVATPGGSGGGVAARTGGVNVAGPGAPTARSVAAPVTIEPETGVPVVASPGAPPEAAAPVAAPGTATTPQPPPGATPAAPVPNIPPPPPRLQNGLDAQQNRTIQDLKAIVPRSRAEFDRQQQLVATKEQEYRQHNETLDRQYRTDVQQAQRDAQTDVRQNVQLGIQQEQLRISQQTQQIALDKAKREAADLALRGPTGEGLPNQDRRMLLRAYDNPDVAKTPEYAAAYANLAEPKIADGLQINPDMTPFKLPQDKEGKPILSYGQPKLAIGPGDLGKYRAIDEQFTTITHTLDVLQKAWEDASATERAETLAGLNTPLRTAWTNAALISKGDGLYQLGVISGPDQELLRGVYADPTTFWGSLTSTATATKQIGMVKDLLGARRAAAQRAYGGGMAIGSSGGGGSAGSKPRLKFDAQGNMIP